MDNLFDISTTTELSPALALAGMAGCCILSAGLVIDVALLVRLVRQPPDWHSLSRRVARRPWSWREAVTLLLILVGFHGFLFAGFSLLHALRPEAGPTLTVTGIVAQTLCFHGIGLVAIVAMMRVARRTWGEAFGADRLPPGRAVCLGVGAYLAAMPMVTVWALLYRIILETLHYPVQPQEVIQLFVDASYPAWLKVYIAVVAVTLAPVAEEILFRGIALPVVLRRFGLRPAVIIISATFAAVHFSLPAVAPLFVIAVAFAIAYVYTGSIVVPIVMHTVFNGVSLGALLILRESL